MSSPIECSASKPWGIHAVVLENACSRCGWVATSTPALDSSVVDPEPIEPNQRDILGG